MAEIHGGGDSDPRRAASRLTRLACEAQFPAILNGERIVFTATTPGVQSFYTAAKTWFQECGLCPHDFISDICVDWEMLLREGLAGRKKAASDRYAAEGGERLKVLSETVGEAIDAVLALAERYREYAASRGEDDVAAVLAAVPAHPAGTYREALQSVKFVHSALLLSGHSGVDLGRFDQYMWPFLSSDVSGGVLGWDDAAGLTAEFLISIGKDSDIFAKCPSGGSQSLSLGGVGRNGELCVNRLTDIVLDAARMLRLPEPLINLRVTPDTPKSVIVKSLEASGASVRIRYSNDSEVIPGLAALGYETSDARNYSVASGGEFLIPGLGMDLVNAGEVPFHQAADSAVGEGLASGDTFDEIMERCGARIARQTDEAVRRAGETRLFPAPLCTALMTGQLETKGDISEGAKYSNIGVHALGAVNAADSLCEAWKHLFVNSYGAEKEPVPPGSPSGYPRTGDDDPVSNDILRRLFAYFAAACERFSPVSGRWNRVRPGTGRMTGGTGDEAASLASVSGGGGIICRSLTPAIGTRVKEPENALHTFSMIDYRRVCNGGPATIEFADSSLGDRASVDRAADMVEFFVLVGCQQLQILVMNANDLDSARRHPDRHGRMIVSVCGWDMKFCDLPDEYQREIVLRCIPSEV
ncbi:MAG: hypothetical protein LBR87_05575 [Synergistaceae bacterium]|nr:hypothetical protein [Synergistaceae bacterium]